MIPKTLAFACALKDVTTPAVVTDPRRLRFFPSIVVKSPPRYTVDPETTIARTAPDALGAHDVTAPVERLNAATWFRTAVWPVWSSTSVNVPPRYTVLPLTAIAITRPLVCHVESGAGAMVASAGGAHASAMPAAAAIVAIVPLVFTACPPVASRAPAVCPRPRNLSIRKRRGGRALGVEDGPEAGDALADRVGRRMR